MKFKQFSGSRRGSWRKRRAVAEIVQTLLLVAIVVSLGVFVFAFASGGLSTITQGFTGLISGQGNAVAEHFTVEQVTYSPGGLAVEASTTAQFSSTSSGTFAMTTTSSNDIIVVLVANENHGAGPTRTVSGITSTGLVFALRGAAVSLGTPAFSDTEVWWAKATSPLALALITVSLSGSADDASVVAFAVSGANSASPWDSHAQATGSGTASGIPTVSGTTNNAQDIILGFTGVGAAAGAEVTESYGPGFLMIQDQINNGGTGSSQAAAESQVVSSTQAGLSEAFSAANTNWMMIGDAIQAAASPTPGADVYVRNVGSVPSTLVSVYVVDQSTGAFTTQVALNLPLNVGTSVYLSHNTLTFTWAHGHTYSYTVTSNLGNSVIFNAKAA